ncbi:6-bladed beta-propeller [Saccharicrinis sp. FJH2]|uniref:6-bladed beta-propeller n=1 Tax=Saccharicrinis sp. FJH65 TaxID=3344659 RepID=UPI0035F37C04
MNKPLNLLWFLLTSMVLNTGCQSTAEKKNPEVTVIELGDYLAANSKIKLSGFIDSIAYIPLETNENCLMGSFISFGIKGSHIIISDESTSSIYIFMQNGKFLSRIGHQGKGPGEYVSVSDFYLSDDSIVHIYSSRNKAILRYDLTGTYLNNDIPVTQTANQICNLGDDKIVGIADYTGFNSNQVNYDAFVSDENGKILKRFLPCPDSLNVGYLTLPLHNISSRDNLVRFILPYSNTIYEIDQNLNLRPAYSIDYGRYNIDEAFHTFLSQPQIEMEEFMTFFNQKKYCNLVGYVENDIYLVLLTLQNQTANTTVYSKPDRQIMSGSFSLETANNGFFENDIDGLPIVGIYAMDTNYLYSVIDPLTVLKHKENQGSEALPSSNIDKILSSISPNSNPLIVRLKLKK